MARKNKLLFDTNKVDYQHTIFLGYFGKHVERFLSEQNEIVQRLLAISLTEKWKLFPFLRMLNYNEWNDCSIHWTREFLVRFCDTYFVIVSIKLQGVRTPMRVWRTYRNSSNIGQQWAVSLLNQNIDVNSHKIIFSPFF